MAAAGKIGRVGILNGGGDAPGLNAVIRGVVVRLAREDVETLAFMEGWRGIIENSTRVLKPGDVADIVRAGGTIIGTSRTNPHKNAARDVPKLVESFRKNKLDGLIAVGGDDTLGAANRLWLEEKLPVLGVPKTIDNDLCATDYTFGFDTAINVCAEAIDRLITTAESHRRIMIVEVMGRHAGHIAAHAGIATGADVVLVPERITPFSEIVAAIKRARASGRLYNLIVAAEGAEVGGETVVKDGVKLDAFGHETLGGIGARLAQMLRKELSYEVRTIALGHLQRGGAPSAFDRVLGTRYGVRAAEMALAGEWGWMPALRGNEIVSVSLAEAVGATKVVGPDLLALMDTFST